MKNNYFFGVVESRNDPLKLGRCRVRIIGIHTENNVILPTNDLPWATPIQPINSAGVSGVGISPSGILEGSWVVIVFADSLKQIPLMLGTIAGLPGKEEQISNGTRQEATTDDSTTIKPDDEKYPSEVKPSDPILPTEKYLGSLTKENFDKMISTLGSYESSGKSTSISNDGSLGKYGMSSLNLERSGYVVNGTWSSTKTNFALTMDTTVWTGKNGIGSSESFLSDAATQKSIVEVLFETNYRTLKSIGLVNDEMPPTKLSGLLTVAYAVGAGQVKPFLDGEIINAEPPKKIDAQGYYTLGYGAITDEVTNETPTTENINSQAVDMGLPKTFTNADYDVDASEVVIASVKGGKGGFVDPNGIWPRVEYDNEADTPRLSRNQNVDKTIVAQKEAARKQFVSIANSSTTWNQPKVPYNAKYPFNKVTETESGHIIEIDDTPDNERLNTHHKSGTFTEIDVNGSQTNKIVGHNCTIVEKDGLIFVKGNGHIHVDGSFTLKTGAQTVLEISGSLDVKAKEINLESSGEVNIRGTNINFDASSFNVKSAGRIDMKAGSMIAADGSTIHFNEGASSPKAAKVANRFTGEFKDLFIPTREDAQEMANEDEPVAQRKNELIEKSAPPVKEIPKEEPKQAPTPPVEVSSECGFILPISINTQLSTNFKIKDLLKGESFNPAGQHGKSAAEIACNMKHLCMNVIEPLFARYKKDGIKINSGLRRPKGNGKVSQHELGEAVDLGFSAHRGKKNDREEYFRIAQEISQLIAYDQMIMEYTSSGSVWIHISFTTGKTLRRHAFTMNNHRTYAQGLKLLA